jgi:ribosomal protein S18 acetylase RimI-like enzyme
MEEHTHLRVGRIELIRVLPEYSGFGFGTSLVNYALNWFKDYVDIVEAGTEVNNYAALRIYQKCGFKIVNSAISFHRYAPDSES